MENLNYSNCDEFCKILQNHYPLDGEQWITFLNSIPGILNSGCRLELTSLAVQEAKILLLHSKCLIIMVSSNCDSNIGLLSIAPGKGIALNLLCVILVSVLCFFS